MPVRSLPLSPNLEHLKYQARDLIKSHAARDPVAAQRIREFHPRWLKADDAEILALHLRLSDAQLTIAREYGFRSWARLKCHIETPTLVDRLDLPHHQRIEDPIFRRGVELIDVGDEAGLREHLKRHPDLVHQHLQLEGGNYFRNPTLLEFIAENPVRQGTMPKNVGQIATVILDAGPELSAIDDTLMLVATGRVPRECGVQIPLIRLLCDRGADPNRAAEAAAVLFERQAVVALMLCGARMTLPLAAALGEHDQVRSLLKTAGSAERQMALALAAQYGYALTVKLLLDAGEDPNRFNPIGCHSHSTPLHQAAWNGHLDVVKLLVERGAKTDIQDILFGGTPADWAKHAGQNEVEAYLRSLDKDTAERK